MLLGLHLIVEHAAAARAYLGQLNPKDDASGTGPQAYARNSLRVRELQASLAKAKEPWARHLAQELRALNLMVDGFRALSDKRNQVAATFTTRLLQRHPKSLAVLLLQ